MDNEQQLRQLIDKSLRGSCWKMVSAIMLPPNARLSRPLILDQYAASPTNLEVETAMLERHRLFVDEQELTEIQYQ